MKTLFEYLIKAFVLCVLLISCDQVEEYGWDNGSFPRDTSLAGTVSDGAEFYYQGTVVCKYNGNTICDGISDYGMDLGKVSDQEVSLSCVVGNADSAVHVSIPIIPLYGVPSDASLDYSTSDGVVRINGIDYSSVTLSVRGWIRDTQIPKSRYSPYRPNYECDISITGKVADKDFALTMSGTTEWK